MKEKRQELLNDIRRAQDETSRQVMEFDSVPHRYGQNLLYLAEIRIIEQIAMHPGITTTELAAILQRTASACSQVVRKLRERNFVEQSRNLKNNRLYNLTLTAEGMAIYQEYEKFLQNRWEMMFRLFSEFSEEELEAHLQVQKKILEVYRADVKMSREEFAK